MEIESARTRRRGILVYGRAHGAEVVVLEATIRLRAVAASRAAEKSAISNSKARKPQCATPPPPRRPCPATSSTRRSSKTRPSAAWPSSARSTRPTAATSAPAPGIAFYLNQTRAAAARARPHNESGARRPAPPPRELLEDIFPRAGRARLRPHGPAPRLHAGLAREDGRLVRGPPAGF